MHQLQCIDQNLLQRPQCRCSCAVLLVIQARLHHFNIPVTVFIPDEIINLLCRQTKVIFAQAFLYFLRQRVYLGQNPFIRRGQHQELGFFAVLHIHHHEAGRIPHLVAEVSAIIQSFPVETHIVTGCVACNQHQTQGVSAVICDNLQRVNPIAQRFGEFSPLIVTNQAVNQNIVKRSFANLLDAGEYHSDNPEENDIIACYQNACGIEMLQLLCFIAGKAEHHALIAGTCIKFAVIRACFVFQRMVNAQCDIGGLSVDSGQNGAGFAVEAVFCSDDFFNINISLCCNLAHNHNHACCGAGFAGNTGIGVLCQKCVQHAIGNLVTDFIGMSLCNRFGCK